MPQKPFQLGFDEGKTDQKLKQKEDNGGECDSNINGQILVMPVWTLASRESCKM